MNKDVECPYCGEWQEISHDDGYGYEEGVTHEQECEDCEKLFTFETSISFDYESCKADCLNGSPHEWRKPHKLWLDKDKELWKRRCGTCDKSEQEYDPSWAEEKKC